MEIGGYDMILSVPISTDVVFEVESVISLFWPNYVIEYDNSQDRHEGSDKELDFFIYRNVKVKERVDELGVTDKLSKSFLSVHIREASDDDFEITFVSDKPEGETEAILTKLKEALNATKTGRT